MQMMIPACSSNVDNHHDHDHDHHHHHHHDNDNDNSPTPLPPPPLTSSFSPPPAFVVAPPPAFFTFESLTPSTRSMGMIVDSKKPSRSRSSSLPTLSRLASTGSIADADAVATVWGGKPWSDRRVPQLEPEVSAMAHQTVPTTAAVPDNLLSAFCPTAAAAAAVPSTATTSSNLPLQPPLPSPPPPPPPPPSQRPRPTRSYRLAALAANLSASQKLAYAGLCTLAVAALRRCRPHDGSRNSTARASSSGDAERNKRRITKDATEKKEKWATRNSKVIMNRQQQMADSARGIDGVPNGQGPDLYASNDIDRKVGEGSNGNGNEDRIDDDGDDDDTEGDDDGWGGLALRARKTADPFEEWAARWVERVHTVLDVAAEDRRAVGERLIHDGVTPADLARALVVAQLPAGPPENAKLPATAFEEPESEPDLRESFTAISASCEAEDATCGADGGDLRHIVLTHLFLTCVLDGTYDARSRVALRWCCGVLGVRWSWVVEMERRAAGEWEETRKVEVEVGAVERRNGKDVGGRWAMAGVAAVAGGAVIGITAGLAAPLILSGLTAAAAGTAFASTVVSGTTGVALIATGGAVTGGSLTGYKMLKRTRGVTDFSFVTAEDAIAAIEARRFIEKEERRRKKRVKDASKSLKKAAVGCPGTTERRPTGDGTWRPSSPLSERRRLSLTLPGSRDFDCAAAPASPKVQPQLETEDSSVTLQTNVEGDATISSPPAAPISSPGTADYGAAILWERESDGGWGSGHGSEDGGSDANSVEPYPAENPWSTDGLTSSDVGRNGKGRARKENGDDGEEEYEEDEEDEEAGGAVNRGRCLIHIEMESLDPCGDLDAHCTDTLDRPRVTSTAATDETAPPQPQQSRPPTSSLSQPPHLSILVTVAGWLPPARSHPAVPAAAQLHADHALPFSTLGVTRHTQHHVLLWESQTLRELGAVLRLLAAEVAGLVVQQGVQSALMAVPAATGAAGAGAGATAGTVAATAGAAVGVGALGVAAATVMAGLAAPMLMMKLNYLVDNPWANGMARAKRVGRLLADTLIAQSAVQSRPVSLAGFSLGARVIFFCLLELGNSSENGFGLVQDVFLAGAPVEASHKEWELVRSVVAGRLVNGYLSWDWVLAGLCGARRGNDKRVGVAGMTAVEGGVGVENVCLDAGVKSHLEYRRKMPWVMKAFGVEVDSDNLDEEEDDEEEAPASDSSASKQQRRASWSGAVASWFRPKPSKPTGTANGTKNIATAEAAKNGDDDEMKLQDDISEWEGPRELSSTMPPLIISTSFSEEPPTVTSKTDTSRTRVKFADEGAAATCPPSVSDLSREIAGEGEVLQVRELACTMPILVIDTKESPKRPERAASAATPWSAQRAARGLATETSNRIPAVMASSPRSVDVLSSKSHTASSDRPVDRWSRIFGLRPKSQPNSSSTDTHSRPVVVGVASRIVAGVRGTGGGAGGTGFGYGRVPSQVSLLFGDENANGSRRISTGSLP